MQVRIQFIIFHGERGIIMENSRQFVIDCMGPIAILKVSQDTATRWEKHSQQ